MISAINSISQEMQKPANELKIIVLMIGAIWAAITFWIGYRNDHFKKRMELFKLLKEYNKELQAWANEVINVMTTAGHFCEVDPQQDTEYYKKRLNLMNDLSSHIDKGRFFLPNTGKDDDDNYKDAAYRGFRSKALNAITASYDIVSNLNYKNYAINKPFGDRIMKLKRVFVSEIQTQLDPIKFEKTFKSIVN